MTNQCKINVRKRNSKHWKWRQNGGRNPSQIHENKLQKHITKNDAQISAQKLWTRRGPGPGVPEEVRTSSGDSRFKKQTFGKQLKSNALEPLGGYLARTRRASRHGADLSIEFACGKVPLWAHRDGSMRRLGCLVLSSDAFAESVSCRCLTVST